MHPSPLLIGRGTAVVRPYREEDRGEILELWKDFDQDHYIQNSRIFKKPSMEEMVERHRRYSSGSPYYLLTVQEGESCLGFICGIIRDTPTVALLKTRRIMEIHGLCVGRAHRNGKTAGDLLQGAIDLGTSNSVSHLEGSIWYFNGLVEKLVQRFGFRLQSSKYSLCLKN